jgi:hypothetical protein
MTWITVGVTGGSALLGFLGAKKAPKQQTTTSQFNLDPAAGLGLNRGLAELLNSYNTQQGQGGVPLAPLSQTTQGAMSAIQQRAQAGNPLVNQAQQFGRGLLGGGANTAQMNAQYGVATPASVGTNPFAAGKMQNPFATAAGNTAQTTSMFAGGQGINPYLQQVFDTSANATQNRSASEFAKAGQYASPQHQGARSEELQTLAASIFAPGYEAERQRQYGAAEAGIDRGYSQAEANLGRQYGATEANLGRQFSGTEADLARQFSGGQAQADRETGLYDAERQRQMAAMGMSPEFANQDWQNLSQLLNVGGMQDTRAQAELDRPGANLDQLLSRLGQTVPMFSGSQTATTPLYSNPYAGLAGGAMMGSYLAPQIQSIFNRQPQSTNQMIDPYAQQPYRYA